MGQMSYAVFVDLENAGAKQSTLQNIIEKVKIRGDILLGKGIWLYRPVYRAEGSAAFQYV